MIFKIALYYVQLQSKMSYLSERLPQKSKMSIKLVKSAFSSKIFLRNVKWRTTLRNAHSRCSQMMFLLVIQKCSEHDVYESFFSISKTWLIETVAWAFSYHRQKIVWEYLKLAFRKVVLNFTFCEKNFKLKADLLYLI